jgi:hypothetical protein
MRTLIAALTIALLPVAAHAQSNPSLATSRGQKYHSYQEMKPRYQKEMDDALYKTKDNHTKMRSKHTDPKRVRPLKRRSLRHPSNLPFINQLIQRHPAVGHW